MSFSFSTKQMSKTPLHSHAEPAGILSPSPIQSTDPALQILLPVSTWSGSEQGVVRSRQSTDYTHAALWR